MLEFGMMGDSQDGKAPAASVGWVFVRAVLCAGNGARDQARMPRESLRLR
jgi:hypothetical protein